jgi:hypothetical protein
VLYRFIVQFSTLGKIWKSSQIRVRWDNSPDEFLDPTGDGSHLESRSLGNTIHAHVHKPVSVKRSAVSDQNIE